MLNDPDLGQTILRAATGEEGLKLLVLGHQMEIGGPGLIGYTTRTGKSHVSLNVSDDPHFVRNPLLPFTNSELALPLVVNDKIIGVLDVQSQRMSAFVEDDIPVLETVAHQLAIAYENARLYSTANCRADELNVLFKLSQAISENLELEAFLQTTYDCIGSLMDNEAFWIASYSPGDEHYHYLIKMDQGENHPGGRAALDEGIGGYTIRNRTPSLTEQPSRKRLFPTARFGSADPIESAICVPLILGEQIVGVMSTQSYRPNAFGDAELDLLERLSGTVAIALENSRIYADARRSSNQLVQLNELAGEMTGVFSVRELGSEIARAIYTRFNPYNVGILSLDPGQDQVVLEGVAGIFEDILTPGEYTHSLGTGIIGRSAKERRILCVNSTAEHEDYVEAASVTIGSELALPLLTGGELLGVLNIEHEQEHAFDESQIALFSTLADQLAIALKSARLYEEVTRRVEELEQLYEVSVTITESNSLDELIDRTTQIIGRNLYPRNFGFMFVNTAGTHLETHPSYIGLHSRTSIQTGLGGPRGSGWSGIAHRRRYPGR